VSTTQLVPHKLDEYFKLRWFHITSRFEKIHKVWYKLLLDKRSAEGQHSKFN